MPSPQKLEKIQDAVGKLWASNAELVKLEAKSEKDAADEVELENLRKTVEMLENKANKLFWFRLKQEPEGAENLTINSQKQDLAQGYKLSDKKEGGPMFWQHHSRKVTRQKTQEFEMSLNNA